MKNFLCILGTILFIIITIAIYKASKRGEESLKYPERITLNK